MNNATDVRIDNAGNEIYLFTVWTDIIPGETNFNDKAVYEGLRVEVPINLTSRSIDVHCTGLYDWKDFELPTESIVLIYNELKSLDFSHEEAFYALKNGLPYRRIVIRLPKIKFWFSSRQRNRKIDEEVHNWEEHIKNLK